MGPSLRSWDRPDGQDLFGQVLAAVVPQHALREQPVECLHGCAGSLLRRLQPKALQRRILGQRLAHVHGALDAQALTD